jgi:arylsulfatase A-like enzyme
LPISSGWLRSLVVGDWHFIQHERGQAELYRFSTDPGELTNLAETPDGRRLVLEFKNQLARITARAQGAS